MKLETQLFEECRNRNYNCSITYQRITSYSIEIYSGYQNNYEQHFYIDGYAELKSAIIKALKFLKKSKL